MKKYKLYGYEVWKDAENSYYVNDIYSSTIIIDLPDEPTDRQIIKALKDAEFLKKNFRYASFEIDGEPGYTLYINYIGYLYNGFYPLCELRCIS